MNSTDRQITIRLRAHEKSLIDRALKRTGYSLQAWAQLHLVGAAEDELIDPAARSRLHRLTLINAMVTRHILEDKIRRTGDGDEVDRIIEEVTGFVEDMQGNASREVV